MLNYYSHSKLIPEFLTQKYAFYSFNPSSSPTGNFSVFSQHYLCNTIVFDLSPIQRHVHSLHGTKFCMYCNKHSFKDKRITVWTSAILF